MTKKDENSLLFAGIATMLTSFAIFVGFYLITTEFIVSLIFSLLIAIVYLTIIIIAILKEIERR